MPLKFIPQPSILSKQAIDLKNSLEKLKELGSRKIQRQNLEAQQSGEQGTRKGTFGKEKEGLIKKSNNLKLVTQKQLNPPFESDSASPIKFQVTQ